MNKVILIGNLTRDPELRYTPNGVAVTTFTLAINQGYGDNKRTDYPNVVVWNKPAENAARFLKKGSKAAVEGRIQTRSYENNDGRKVYVTEVVAEKIEFLDSKSSTQDPFQGESEPIEINDEDLPF